MAMSAGYKGGVPPMPGQYPPQPGMGYPQQPPVPGTHMSKGYPPAPVSWSFHAFCFTSGPECVKELSSK